MKLYLINVIVHFYQVSCRILEAVIRIGWEVVVSPRTTITPGYELSTWILKQVTTPALNTAEVAAFAIGDGFIQVVRDTKTVEVSNVIRRAVKKCIKDKESSDSPLKRYTPASKSDIRHLLIITFIYVKI